MECFIKSFGSWFKHRNLIFTRIHFLPRFSTVCFQVIWRKKEKRVLSKWDFWKIAILVNFESLKIEFQNRAVKLFLLSIFGQKLLSGVIFAFSEFFLLSVLPVTTKFLTLAWKIYTGDNSHRGSSNVANLRKFPTKIIQLWILPRKIRFWQIPKEYARLIPALSHLILYILHANELYS